MKTQQQHTHLNITVSVYNTEDIKCTYYFPATMLYLIEVNKHSVPQ